MPTKLSKTHTFILYTLGLLYDELNRRLKKKYLRIAIPKYIFIELVMKAHITEKKTRALYRNLEHLEKKKYLSYDNRNLALTKKGTTLYNRIAKEQEPYNNLNKIIGKGNVSKFSRKSQTVFRL